MEWDEAHGDVTGTRHDLGKSFTFSKYTGDPFWYHGIYILELT